MVLKSVCRGKYWRVDTLAFSLLPRCHAATLPGTVRVCKIEVALQARGNELMIRELPNPTVSLNPQMRRHPLK